MKAAIIAFLLVFSLAGSGFAADDPSIPGTYISKHDSKEYLVLYPDGTFLLKQRKIPPVPDDPFMEIKGQYQKSGNSIDLKLADQGEASLTLKENTLEDAEGISWVKQGTEKPKELVRPKAPKIKWY